MKARRLLGIAVGSVVAVTCLLVGVVHAAGTNEVVSGVTNHSVYKAGNTVTVNGIVNGDIFCAGQTITIDATVNGDVLCAGQDINIQGRISGNVRLVGQTVNVGAAVAGSASVAGQSITIENGASIGRDLSLVAETATVSGGVARDVSGAINTATLNASVGRNVSLRVRHLTLGGSANIQGDLNYTSPSKLQQSSGAKVFGTTTYHVAQMTHRNSSGLIWAKVFWMFAIMVFGVVLLALFPRLFDFWNPAWGPDFWWALLIGFVAMFAVPVISFVLMLTLVGIPLGIIVILLWIVAGFVAMALAAYFLGTQIVPQLHPILIILVGGAILGIVQLIPVLGWVIGFVAYWVGSGILLRGLKQHYVRPSYEVE
jgi:hypothetical protein